MFKTTPHKRFEICFYKSGEYEAIHLNEKNEDGITKGIQGVTNDALWAVADYLACQLNNESEVMHLKGQPVKLKLVMADDTSDKEEKIL